MTPLLLQAVSEPPAADQLAPVAAATRDLLYSYDVEATDPEVGDTLAFSLVLPADMGPGRRLDQISRPEAMYGRLGNPAARKSNVQ